MVDVNLTAQITDHMDASGASLVLPGNVGTAEVFVNQFTGSNWRKFTKVGQVVDGGTLNMAIAPSAYMLLAVNGTKVSLPTTFRVSDGILALHMRCLEATREYVLGLALPGVDTDPRNHRIVKLPYRPGVEFKAEEGVYYFPKPESVSIEDNLNDTVTYGVQVVTFRKNHGEMTLGLEDALKARELLSRSFSGTPFPDLYDVHTIHIQPGAVILPEQWRLQFDASTVVFSCISQQQAGVI